MWDRLQVNPGHGSDSPFPVAAVLVPLFEDWAGDLRMILTKRPETMPTHAGHISFPGGRPHPEDDGPVATALREAQEEVGIEPATVEVLGFLPEIHTVEYQLLVVPVVGRLATTPNLRPSPREVARVFIPAVAELAEPERWRSEMWVTDAGDRRRVWFYDLDGDVLWGATARMVRNLLALAD